MDNLNNEEENQPLFNFVVSNIPYNEDADASGDTNFEKPVYDKYMDACKDIGEGVDLVHPARFLFNAGATPKKWNEKMLNDEHFKVFEYEPDSSKYFLNTDIKGGIAVTYYDRRKNFKPIKTFIPFPELKSIVKKVQDALDKGSIADIAVSAYAYHFTEVMHKEHPEAQEKQSKGHKYDLTSNIIGKLSTVFFDDKPDDVHQYVTIIGRVGNKRVEKYIRREYLNNVSNFNAYKVFVPKANGSGALGEVLSTPLIGEPLIGEPLIGATETFLSIGCFDTKSEAKNCMKYIKTKFARIMLGVLKVTQDNNKNIWRLVPLQDFSSNSDIDWSKSISEIDQQLYKKYNLSDKEIDFIETHVKEMV